MKRLLLSAVLASAACKDATSPYENVAGSYASATICISNPSLPTTCLASVPTLGITQKGASLSGTWIATQYSTPPVQETGTLSGSVSSGSNPTVHLVLTSATCPNNTMTLSAAFDGVKQQIVVSGPMLFWGASSCTPRSENGPFLFVRDP